MKRIVFSTPPLDPDPGAEIFGLIGEWAQQRAAAVNAEVEHRILEGEDRIEVPYLAGSRDFRTVVYTVPSWWREPRRRLKVAVARLAHRYDQRRTQWGGRRRV